MQPRSRLRHRLIRWLAGRQATPDLAALNLEHAGELVLPAPDAAQQATLAGRYFSHAEELIRRGAAELSAPYYRQAYALLKASMGESLPEQIDTDRNAVITSSVVDLTNHGGAEASPPLPSELTEAGTPRATAKVQEINVVAAIDTLRSQLSSTTADAIQAEAIRLRKQVGPHPDLDHLHGMTLLVKGDAVAAAERFRMVLTQAPGHFKSLVSLGGLVLAQGRLEEAQALLQKALQQVNPDSPEAVPALTNLSLVFSAQGRVMDESLLVLKIHKLKPGHLRNERLLTAARVLQDMAEEAAAIELLQWLSEKQGGEQIWKLLATLLERRGDYQAAALVYRKLLQPQPATSQERA